MSLLQVSHQSVPRFRVLEQLWNHPWQKVSWWICFWSMTPTWICIILCCHLHHSYPNTTCTGIYLSWKCIHGRFLETSLEVSCSPCQKLLSCKNFPLRLPLRGSHTGIANSAGEIHLLPRKSGLVNWYDSTRCSIFGCFLGKGWLVLMLNCDWFSHPYLIDIIHESTAFTLIVLGSGLGCSRF